MPLSVVKGFANPLQFSSLFAQNYVTISSVVQTPQSNFPADSYGSFTIGFETDMLKVKRAAA